MAASGAGVPPEVSCPLCLDLLHEPISTPCRHVFCRACVAGVLGAGFSSCPLCRADLRGFDAEAAPADEAAAALVASAVPEEQIRARARELLRRLELVVGNLYEEVASRSRNTNKWTMYVTLRGVASQHTAALIEKVVYDLHPTFKPQVVTALPPTFGISRFGWGTFAVGCEIHWSRRLRMPPTKVDHYLIFEGNGGRTAAAVDVDPEVLESVVGARGREAAAGSGGALAPAGARGGDPADDAPTPAGDQPQGSAAWQTMDVVVGNRCEERADGKFKWTMYVRLPGFPGASDRMIESVTYELHPTFTPSTVSCRAPPFEIARVGWGTFPVICTIAWSRALRLEPTEVVHELSAAEGGGQTAASVRVRSACLRRQSAPR